MMNAVILKAADPVNGEKGRENAMNLQSNAKKPVVIVQEVNVDILTKFILIRIDFKHLFCRTLVLYDTSLLP